MAQDTWTAVDKHVTGLLAPPDEALDAAVRAGEAASRVRRGGGCLIIADNVIRDGRLVDPSDDDPVMGKGYDGFSLARVLN